MFFEMKTHFVADAAGDACGLPALARGEPRVPSRDRQPALLPAGPSAALARLFFADPSEHLRIDCHLHYSTFIFLSTPCLCPQKVLLPLRSTS